MSRIKVPATLRRLLLAASALAAGIWIVGVLAASPAAACTDCSCYFSSDCKDTGRGDYCDYVGDCLGGSGCTCVNKPDTKINGVLICGESPGDPRCDGVCRKKKSTGVTWDDVTVDQVADAFDLYLSAYLDAGLNGGGGPQPVLIGAAQAVPLDPAWRAEVEHDVHQIILVLLGGDFLTAQPNAPCPRPFGQVPALDLEAADLIDTVRQVFVDGVRTGDLSGIRPAIDGFWATATYRPHHPHGCYPHGHANAPDLPTCQGNQIEGLATVVLRGQSPVSETPKDPASLPVLHRGRD